MHCLWGLAGPLLLDCIIIVRAFKLLHGLVGMLWNNYFLYFNRIWGINHLDSFINFCTGNSLRTMIFSPPMFEWWNTFLWSRCWFFPAFLQSVSVGLGFLVFLSSKPHYVFCYFTPSLPACSVYLYQRLPLLCHLFIFTLASTCRLLCFLLSNPSCSSAELHVLLLLHLCLVASFIKSLEICDVT